jgi:hypothetical protein
LKGDTTRLTVGNLLLSIRRLETAVGSYPDSGFFSTLRDQIAAVQHQWQSRWEIKISLEVPNRMSLWKNYLSELGAGSQALAGDYAYNVRLRVILELLLIETSALFVKEKSLLRSLDLRLKSKGIPGDFIWDGTIESGFPIEPFWYLYFHFQS